MIAEKVMDTIDNMLNVGKSMAMIFFIDCIINKKIHDIESNALFNRTGLPIYTDIMVKLKELKEYGKLCVYEIYNNNEDKEFILVICQEIPNEGELMEIGNAIWLITGENIKKYCGICSNKRIENMLKKKIRII